MSEDLAQYVVPATEPAPDQDQGTFGLPAPSSRSVVYFHIGAPKTGTTFLQRIMFQNRAELLEAGVLYPGESFGAHVQAAFDLRAAGFHGYKDPNVPGAWGRFVAAAKTWAGPVIFSQELFSPASPSQVDRALDDLDFAEVHLIYTARELTRQIPAAWQEDLKNRFTVSFDEFLTALRDPSRDPQGLGRMFWRMQDAVEVLERWSRGVPPERVHIVTVPQTGGDPDLLWRRFAGVVGLDPYAFDISDAFQNTSLGAAEARFLHRLNLALDNEVGWPLYNEMVKHHLAQEVLVRRGSSARIRLPADQAEWFARRGTELVEGLRTSRFHIVGSLDDLMPPDDDDVAGDPAEPPLEAELDVAIEAVAALLLRISRLRRGVIPR